jgi:hypothetical protein
MTSSTRLVEFQNEDDIIRDLTTHLEEDIKRDEKFRVIIKKIGELFANKSIAISVVYAGIYTILRDLDISESSIGFYQKKLFEVFK